MDLNYACHSPRHPPETGFGPKTGYLAIYGDKNPWMGYEFLITAMDTGEAMPFILWTEYGKLFGDFYLSNFDIAAPIYSGTAFNALFVLSGGITKLEP